MRVPAVLVLPFFRAMQLCRRSSPVHMAADHITAATIQVGIMNTGVREVFWIDKLNPNYVPICEVRRRPLAVTGSREAGRGYQA